MELLTTPPYLTQKLKKSRNGLPKMIYQPNESGLSFQKFKDTNIKLMPLKKKACNYLNTKDIDGAKPMKFKHRFKRFVEEANNKSHFLRSGTQLNQNSERPFKPGIKMVYPYNEDTFSSMRPLILPEPTKRSGIYSNLSNSNLSTATTHSRNRSVDLTRSRGNLSYMNNSLDSLCKIKREHVQKLNESSSGITNFIERMGNMKGRRNFTSVYS